MSTFDDVVNDVLQTLQGYGLAQSRAAFLSADVTASDLSLSVANATDFEQGVAEVGNEIVFIDSVDLASNILTIAPDGRGWFGTTAAAHSRDDRITMAPVWPKQQVAQAINEAIIGTYPTLFGVAQTQFTFSPVQTTYELPAACVKVLRVVTDTIGPSNEGVQINRWSFNSNANTSVFASGNSLTLEEAGEPGRTITVTYQTEPVEITFGDPWTDSGLSETARLCIKYGAASSLTAFMDTSRLPVDTAQADEYDPSKAGVGTASRISAQLYQRYVMELETERKRLRAATPVPIFVRKR